MQPNQEMDDLIIVTGPTCIGGGGTAHVHHGEETSGPLWDSAYHKYWIIQHWANIHWVFTTYPALCCNWGYKAEQRQIRKPTYQWRRQNWQLILKHVNTFVIVECEKNTEKIVKKVRCRSKVFSRQTVKKSHFRQKACLSLKVWRYWKAFLRGFEW